MMQCKEWTVGDNHRPTSHEIRWLEEIGCRVIYINAQTEDVETVRGTVRFLTRPAHIIIVSTTSIQEEILRLRYPTLCLIANYNMHYNEEYGTFL